MIPIDFIFRLHHIGAGYLSICDVRGNVSALSHQRVQLYSFDHRDRYSDVVWDPMTGELLAATVKGEQRWRSVS